MKPSDMSETIICATSGASNGLAVIHGISSWLGSLRNERRKGEAFTQASRSQCGKALSQLTSRLDNDVPE